ncbi:MAG: hypothetical protein U9Q83_10425, partial [Bacteroidota bacterium]|nr:hypothetical protein [Bacteroidota bacterium]
ENGADVATAAIFLKNEKPKPNNNILHLTFRRTKATIERIVFEIDDYDLHFVDRISAVKNQYIWKNNLLGGGRIKNVVAKYSKYSFKNFLKQTGCIVAEGFKVGSKGYLSPDFIYEMKTIPTKSVYEDRIDLSMLDTMNNSIKFEKMPQESVFQAPNIIIKENIGENRIPIHFNKTSFSFQHKIIGISNIDSTSILNDIVKSFNKFNEFYRFYIFVTSGQLLVNLNTAILKRDIMNIPFFDNDEKNILSEYDKNIISDVNNFMQYFLRNGENSKAVKPIPQNKLKNTISSYGKEFSKVLNLIYKDKGNKFRLSDVVKLNNSFMATIFKYDSKHDEVLFHKDNSKLNLDALTDNEISKQLTVNRIIKLYPDKDTIVFVKPNQYRYWLSLIAYRDADKCFSDLSKLGY